LSEQAGPTARNLSARELAGQLGGQVSQLLRDELALARAELFTRARQAALGGGMLATAALLGLTGWLGLVAAGIAGITVVLPVWAATLIVGGVLLLTSGVIAARAARRLSRGVPLLPLTADSIRRDVREIKEKAGQ
jgi:Flp pilus assembly protein TadB